MKRPDIEGALARAEAAKGSLWIPQSMKDDVKDLARYALAMEAKLARFKDVIEDPDVFRLRSNHDAAMAQVEELEERLGVAIQDIEAGFATRDTNDGSTYCGHCGGPRPKPGKKWKHDPSCPVALIRTALEG